MSLAWMQLEHFQIVVACLPFPTSWSTLRAEACNRLLLSLLPLCAFQYRPSFLFESSFLSADILWRCPRVFLFYLTNVLKVWPGFHSYAITRESMDPPCLLARTNSSLALVAHWYWRWASAVVPWCRLWDYWGWWLVVIFKRVRLQQ